MGRKFGAASFRGGGTGTPSNTKWPGPSSTCMPSCILIRPTIWPQYTNVTDRQDRQDKQRSDSRGRTVLQTVAQKFFKIIFISFYNGTMLEIKQIRTVNRWRRLGYDGTTALVAINH